MSTHVTKNPFDASPGAQELARIIARIAEISRRRARTFVAIFLLSAAAILSVTFFWPGTFEARAAILLQKVRSTEAVDYDPKQPTTVVTGTVSQEEVNSEIAVMTSREVLEKTAAAAGLSRIPTPLYLRILFAPLRGYERLYDWFHEIPYPTREQRAVAGLADAISVDRLKESNVLVVTYRAGSPQFAEIVLDELLKNYLDWHLQVHTRVDAKRFFSEQSARLADEVTSLQNELGDLKRTAGVTDINEARELGMREEASLRDEEALLLRRVAELDGKLASYRDTAEHNRNRTRTSTTTRANSPALDTMRAQALQLELDQIRLEARYTATAPPVIENGRKLEVARRAVQASLDAVALDSTVSPDPTMATIDEDVARVSAESAGLRRRLQTLRTQHAAAQARLRDLDQQALASDRLDLRLKSAKDRYSMYLDRAERAGVDATLDRTGVSDPTIVQRASASPKPVKPARLISFIVSIVGGLVVATLVCAWLELAAIGLAATIETAAPRAAPEEV